MRIPILFVASLMMIASAAAETIDVKYWGPVDLRSYECTDTTSSFVHRICYDESKAHVVVLLRNTYYPYCRVDRGTVSAWLNSSSKGRFYNANIKSDAVAGRFDSNGLRISTPIDLAAHHQKNGLLGFYTPVE
jgi:hypothetical protein